jgi:hypothetical protein
LEGRRTSFAGGCFSILDDESVCCDSKSESVISYPSFARCFYVVSGLQFGLLVDFARSQWSDDVFQEFVDEEDRATSNTLSRIASVQVRGGRCGEGRGVRVRGVIVLGQLMV